MFFESNSSREVEQREYNKFGGTKQILKSERINKKYEKRYILYIETNQI